MTNQFTQLEAITDQDLVNATGGGAGAILDWVAANGGIPFTGGGMLTDGHITKAALDA